jgi:3-hydroxybutyryl-CoA dehydrogenase
LRAAGIEIAQRRTPESIRHAGPHDDAPAFHCNGAAVYLTDGRSATQRARQQSSGHGAVRPGAGLRQRQAHRRGVRRPVRAGGVSAVVGLLQAAGFTVTRLDDVPGMAVMRTVAMLANEAADAVNQGVCSAAAADIAMQKGVNYPRGPLAWADAVGIEHIVRVLATWPQLWRGPLPRVAAAAPQAGKRRALP